MSSTAQPTEIPEHSLERLSSNAAERLKRAQRLTLDGGEGIQAAYGLYDPLVDGYSREWLEIVVRAVGMPECEDFSIRKALDLSMICALSEERGAFSFRDLAHNLLHDSSSVRDYDAAIFWNEKSLGDGDLSHVAARSIADIFIRHDRRFSTSNAGGIFDDVIGFLDDAISQNNEKAAYLKGIVFLFGRGAPKDYDLGLELLERSIDLAVERGFSGREEDIYSSVFAMLMHHLHEADPSNPFKNAAEVYGKYKHHLKEDRQTFWDDFFAFGKRSPYHELAALCARFNQGQVTQRALKKYMEPLLGPEHNQKMASVLSLFMDASVHCSGQTGKRKSWLALFHFIEDAQSGVNEKQLAKSTNDYGPRYNPVNSEGLTILGVWERAANDNKPQPGSYVPAGGVQSLEAIHTDHNGYLLYETKQDQNLPAKLLPEDFEVALALIFGDPEEPILPHFDLPYIEVGENDAGSSMHEKRWGPEWLHQTDLGRSLYAADKLIGDIAFHPLQMPVGTSKDSVTQETPAFAKKFLTDLFNTSGGAFGPQGRRVMLIPENVDLSVSRDAGTDGVTLFGVTDIRIKMRIDGEEVDAGAKKGNESLNDTYYRFPRLSQKLTDQYEALKLYAPLFQRAEEISKLINALYALRVAGYSLPPQIQQDVSENLERYRSTPPLRRQDLLCRPDHDA